jgi:hypothetical protein
MMNERKNNWTSWRKRGWMIAVRRNEMRIDNKLKESMMMMTADLGN